MRSLNHLGISQDAEDSTRCQDKVEAPPSPQGFQSEGGGRRLYEPDWPWRGVRAERRWYTSLYFHVKHKDAICPTCLLLQPHLHLP